MSLYLLKTRRNFTSSGHGHFMFVVWPLFCSSSKVTTGSVFPTFCHATFHHGLITCCNVSRVQLLMIKCIMIWIHLILARPCDQESTNGSPCLGEWKSRNIAVNIVIGSIVGLTLVRTMHVQVWTGFLLIGNGRCHRGRVSYIYDHPLISESYGQCPSRTCRYCHRASWT